MSVPLATGTRLGPYEIRAPLGAGGMGEVYRARDERLRREVAVKVLPAAVSADSDRLRRFEIEARAAGSLQHPNLLAVYDLGSHDGAPYIVSELLVGETLRERLRSGSLPVRRAVEYAVQMARGLAAAHAKGILHRDLKPENVFLTRDGQLKILDFGLAKLLDDTGEGSEELTAPQRTRSGVVMGTVGYMSPEQVKALPLDARSDVFALGVVLYEMLSGQPAFRRETEAETMVAILKQEPPPLAAARPAVPPALVRITELCLEKEPDDRFQGARDLALALQAVSPAETAGSLPSVPAPRWRSALVPGLVALATALAALSVALLVRARPMEAPSFHQLTFQRGAVWSARFAPDGRTVVYSASWNGGPVRVYSTQLGSTESRDLGLPDAVLLSISPSGEMALKLGHALSSYPPGTLARASLAGGAPRELAKDVLFADWDPEGRELAVLRDVDGQQRLEYPIGRVLYAPPWPVIHMRFVAGGRIALLEWVPGSPSARVLSLVDARGRRVELARGFVDWLTVVAWSQATREIWLPAARPGGEIALRGIDLAGRERVVAATPGHLLIHDVDAQGRALASPQLNRWTATALVPGETSERDVSWLDFSASQDISRDGRLALIGDIGARGFEKGRTYIRRLDGSPAVFLGDGWPLALSPDASLVLARPEIGRADSLMLLPVGAGEPRRLEGPDVPPIQDALFSSDGRSILMLAGAEDARQRVYAWSLDGGSPRPLSPEGAYDGMAVSPDGRFVATGGDRLMVHAVAGGESRTVPGAGAATVRQWSADGRSLFVRGRASPEVPALLELVDVATGARRPWKELRPSELTGVWSVEGVALTPDGAGYMYNYRSALSALYLAEGLR